MKIFAHRGASGQFPENSQLAFEHAIKQQADGIELDAQFHMESGQFIVLHDQFLDITTSGTGDFNQYTLGELRQMRLGQGQTLMTLDETLACINGRVMVNIEVKCMNTEPESLATTCVALAETMNIAMINYAYTTEHFMVSSFNHAFLHFFHSVYPEYSLAALIAHMPADHCEFTKNLAVDCVNQSIDTLNNAFVEDAHRRQIKVYVYTVDRYEDIERCYLANVDGIFTNYPEKTRKIAQLYIE